MTPKQLFEHLVKLGKAYRSRGASFSYYVILNESTLRKSEIVGRYDVVKMAVVAWMMSAV